MVINQAITAASVHQGPFATALEAAGFIMPRFQKSAREKLVVVLLDRDHRHLKTAELEGCSVDDVLPVQLILAMALDCDAHRLILAHNHPNGDPTPTAADIKATLRLVVAAAPLGITVQDHLVFGGGGCRSFRELGLL